MVGDGSPDPVDGAVVARAGGIVVEGAEDVAGVPGDEDGVSLAVAVALAGVEVTGASSRPETHPVAARMTARAAEPAERAR
jgi:hypothetical protein